MGKAKKQKKTDKPRKKKRKEKEVVSEEIVAMVKHLGHMEGHGVPEDLHQATLDIWCAGLGAKLQATSKGSDKKYNKLAEVGHKVVRAAVKLIDAENQAKVKKPTYRIGRDPNTGRFIRIEDAQAEDSDGVVILLRKRGKAKPFKD